MQAVTMDFMNASDMMAARGDIDDGTHINRLKKVHARQRKRLTWSKQPYSVMKYFTLAFSEHLVQMSSYIISHRWVLAFSCVCFIIWTTLFAVEGPHEQFMQECLAYFWYALWWVGLGVASSIGLGSGLHTFVLYLAPHVALFTMRSTHCGRVDLKSAQYDTAMYGMESTWALKGCSEFGQPLYCRQPSSERYQVPLLDILHEVHWEAILWGVGTAIGELPPYFVSRAARLSGEKLRVLDDLTADNSSGTSSANVASYINQLKFWAFTKFHHFNFCTILTLASVPNPLFDLAGMICGQLLVPFWKFFIPTLIGKAIIKTHVQTVFIILMFNNQLVEMLDSSLRWFFQKMPAVSHLESYMTSQLHDFRAGYGVGPKAEHKAAPWSFSFSFTFIWNTFVWIMLIGFFSSIINATAQSYLVEKQKKEIEDLEEEKSQMIKTAQNLTE